jgi:uncharacterized protein DUF4386
MTRRTNARVAGVAFLAYIAAALTGTILERSAARGEGIAATLAGIAQHAPAMRLAAVLQLIGCFCALVLAVTLYAITRDVDPDLALLAMTCRVAEGVIGAVSLPRTLGKLWLATAAGADAPDAAAAGALGALLIRLPATWDFTLPAIFFAVGSTIFACLLLRGRIVPAALARLGVLASILVVVILPLELVGIIFGLVNKAMWLPMLVFEVWLALWFIVKGAAVPGRSRLSEA